MQGTGRFVAELRRMILGHSFGFFALNMSKFGHSYWTRVPQRGGTWLFGLDRSCKFDILLGPEG
jgi:hypothetical protein